MGRHKESKERQTARARKKKTRRGHEEPGGLEAWILPFAQLVCFSLLSGERYLFGVHLFYCIFFSPRRSKPITRLALVAVREKRKKNKGERKKRREKEKKHRRERKKKGEREKKEKTRKEREPSE